ncbi:MAG: Na Ca ex protein [Chloroflexi bacterium]|nr:Na Ca ex protein [Chloroflexota bacterium]
MGAGVIVEDLSNVGLLSALPAEEVQWLIPHVEHVEVPAGTRIFSQGEPGDALYLIKDGTARITLDDGTVVGAAQPGDVFGEMALLTGEPRSATVVAETDLSLLRVAREAFDEVVRTSPALDRAFRALAEKHRAGLLDLSPPAPLNRGAWRGRAMRALAARRRGLQGWHVVMGFGYALWALLWAEETFSWVPEGGYDLGVAALQLLCGLAIIFGASEAFILGAERLGARLNLNGVLTGTVASLLSTLPEFVLIAFIIAVQPLAAFVTAVITIFNNALAFSIYSFFLPKDHKGQFLMPPSVARAGGEVLVAGSAIAMIVGVVMLAMRAESQKASLDAADLLVLGGIMLSVYGYYSYALIRYYVEGSEADHPSHPPSPGTLGHDTSWRGIGLMFALGVAGSYFGGQAVGAFADAAINELGLPTIPTAALLAFFGGVAEYIIVWKAHRRGELGIALSNTFGGITQVMLILLPYAMIIIAIFRLATGSSAYVVPITIETTLLMILLFPLCYVLLEYLKEDHTLNNLDAASMTGIYALLLYFLFTVTSG